MAVLNHNHTALDRLPEPLRTAALQKYDAVYSDKPHHRHGLFKCPANAQHHATYTYTWFYGMELICCPQCGYRYELVKGDRLPPQLVDRAAAPPPKPQRIRS